jgi:hypothetical protein
VPEYQVKSLEEAQVHIAALWSEVKSARQEIRRLDKENDTFLRTAAWKRWLFIIDGWSGHRVVKQPKWRPWRKWYRS